MWQKDCKNNYHLKEASLKVEVTEAKVTFDGLSRDTTYKVSYIYIYMDTLTQRVSCAVLLS